MTPVTGRDRRRRVGIFLFDDVKTLDFVGPAEVFMEANKIVDDYELVLMSTDGEPVMTSLGVRVAVHTSVADGGVFDTVMVPGSEIAPRPFESDAVLDAVRDLASRTKRMASICSGAFALAATGLLSGKRATTHWNFAPTLARRFPEINVQADSIFIRDGDVYTSAGVAAGIDLALSLVEADHGADVSRRVAQLLLVYMQRAGGQSQFSASLKARAPRTPLARAVFDFVNADPTRPATIAHLASHVHVSPRHLTRVIKEETGVTPADYVASVRVDIATGCLESGVSIAQVSDDTGFSTPAAFRRAFLARLGVTPSDYQRRFRTTHRHLAS